MSSNDPSKAYIPLRMALEAAYNQATEGKGKERHANAKPFDKQPIMEIGRMVGIGYHLGQAMKKAQESKGMLDRKNNEAAQAELLGAINYLAAAWVMIQEENNNTPSNKENVSPYDTRVIEAFRMAHNDFCESSYGIREKNWDQLDPEMQKSIILVNLDRLKDKYWRVEYSQDKPLLYLLERASVYLKGRGIVPWDT